MMKLLLALVAPLAKFTSKLKQPDPAINDAVMMTIKTLIKDGDCLVSRTSWQFTNLLMPGFYKHAAVYLNGWVYEASTGEGVRKVSLEEFCFKKDFVGLCRYQEMDAELVQVSYGYLENKLGKSYDWDLYLSDNDKFYCSELCFYLYCLCFGDFAKRFKPSKYLGKEVIRPTDLWINLKQIGSWK